MCGSAPTKWRDDCRDTNAAYNRTDMIDSSSEKDEQEEAGTDLRQLLEASWCKAVQKQVEKQEKKVVLPKALPKKMRRIFDEKIKNNVFTDAANNASSDTAIRDEGKLEPATAHFPQQPQLHETKKPRRKRRCTKSLSTIPGVIRVSISSEEESGCSDDSIDFAGSCSDANYSETSENKHGLGEGGNIVASL